PRDSPTAPPPERARRAPGRKTVPLALGRSAPARDGRRPMAEGAASRQRTPPLWPALADALLPREATACRASRGGDLDPLAGLRIDDATGARTIADLAGDGREAAEARAAFSRAVDEAREAFRAALSEPLPFSLMADAAGLDQSESEVFALLCAVDLDPRRQRLVSYVNDAVTRR